MSNELQYTATAKSDFTPPGTKTIQDLQDPSTKTIPNNIALQANEALQFMLSPFANRPHSIFLNFSIQIAVMSIILRPLFAATITEFSAADAPA